MAKNGVEWSAELERELFTPQEIEENNFQAKLICEMINARLEEGLSQRELQERSGLTQSAIARLERGASSPTLDTVFKVLVPLGKTLAVVPLEKQRSA